MVILYLATVSFISIFLTMYDKKIAGNKRKRRVSEKTLFLWAGVGGALAMYLTMLCIHHKTKHKRFMLGLPAFVAWHGLLVFWLHSQGII